MYTEVYMLLLLAAMFGAVLLMRYFAKRVPEKTEKARAVRKDDDNKILFLVGHHRFTFQLTPELYEQIPLEVNGQLSYKGDQFVRFKGDEFDLQCQTEEG